MHTLFELFALLKPYTPTLAGTFPLGIQVEASDIDILCCVPDLDAFERWARASIPGHVQHHATKPPALVVSLTLGRLPVEVFAQELRVEEQNAFRHMIIEGRLLSLGGADLRTAVVDLKRSGIKTEPAFASLLALEGDPYDALLELETWTHEELAALVARARVSRFRAARSGG